jgi:phage repressor protein C with HTH and peptisase S24 domain
MRNALSLITQAQNALSLSVTHAMTISYCELVTEIKDEPSALWKLLAVLKPDELNWAEWSRRARVSTSYFQDLKKGKTPSVDRLARILGVVGVTMTEFQDLLAERDGATTIGRISSPAAKLAGTPDADRYDVPHYGTAQAADFEFTEEGEPHFAEQMDVYLDEPADMRFRPPGLRDSPNSYSLTVRGVSMYEKFDDGDPIYINPDQRPVLGDIVVVQLIRRDSEGEGRVASVLLKKLVKRGAEFIELEQFNPRMRFRVPMRDVHTIHRWVPWGELGLG